MHLSFIGMSGVGKSYWAKQLAQTGWLHLDCDAMIAERLGEIIEVGDDEDPVHAVGRWMGMPWAEGFDEREQQYLDLEAKVTGKSMLKMRRDDGNTVLDTTGSYVYLPGLITAGLKDVARFVYFDVPDDVRQQMIELYLNEPKPVLWQGKYEPNPGESQDNALARCYTDLLVGRAERYRALADVVIDYHAVRQPGFGVADLLKMIGP